jgi:hypothetical protein
MLARRWAPLLWIALLWSVARAAPPATRSPVHARPAGAAQTTLSDRQIEAGIRARFAQSKINEDRFEVRVQGGVATIDGHTGVLQHKGVATRLAKAAGARDVVNRIEPTEAAKQRAAANLAKGRRRAQVKRGETRNQRASR